MIHKKFEKYEKFLIPSMVSLTNNIALSTYNNQISHLFPNWPIKKTRPTLTLSLILPSSTRHKLTQLELTIRATSTVPLLHNRCRNYITTNTTRALTISNQTTPTHKPTIEYHHQPTTPTPCPTI